VTTNDIWTLEKESLKYTDHRKF